MGWETWEREQAKQITLVRCTWTHRGKGEKWLFFPFYPFYEVSRPPNFGDSSPHLISVTFAFPPLFKPGYSSIILSTFPLKLSLSSYIILLPPSSSLPLCKYYDHRSHILLPPPLNYFLCSYWTGQSSNCSTVLGYLFYLHPHCSGNCGNNLGSSSPWASTTGWVSLVVEVRFPLDWVGVGANDPTKCKLMGLIHLFKSD